MTTCYITAFRARTAGAALLLACLLPAAAACAPRTLSPGPNVIIIVVDCLRADHLSLYGYHRRTSPGIDAFAKKSVVFRQAISQAPTTLLSFASIFTSMDVSAHGLTGSVRKLGDSPLTMAEIFKIYGYRTAAFCGGVNLNPMYGFNKGFDMYSHTDRTATFFSDTVPQALAWAEERKAEGEKFLLLVHGNELHTPYAFPQLSIYDKGFKVSPELKAMTMAESRVFAAYKRKIVLRDGKGVLNLTDDDAGHLVARYDEGIRYADASISVLLNKLRKEGLLDHAMVIVTADHGEGLFDHDYYFHDFNMYEDALHVPLLISVPGAAAGNVARQVQLIDLLPTMLEFAGIPPDKEAQGRSLLPLVTGKGEGPAETYSFSESRFGGKVIRSSEWKLMVNSYNTELYNLKNDPGEKKDLAGGDKDKVAELKKILSDRLAADAALGHSEALPAGSGEAAQKTKDAAWQKEIFNEMRGLSGMAAPVQAAASPD